MSWESLIQQHEDGWLLYEGDRLVADLTLSTTDDPFYIFEVKVLTNNEHDLQWFASAKRPISDKLRYKNKKADVIVRDTEFLATFYYPPPNYSLIALRDYRVPGEEEPRLRHDCC